MSASNQFKQNPRNMLIGYALAEMQKRPIVAEAAVHYIIAEFMGYLWADISAYWRKLNNVARTEIVQKVYAENIRIKSMKNNERKSYFLNKYGLDV